MWPILDENNIKLHAVWGLGCLVVNGVVMLVWYRHWRKRTNLKKGSITLWFLFVDLLVLEVATGFYCFLLIIGLIYPEGFGFEHVEPDFIAARTKFIQRLVVSLALTILFTQSVALCIMGASKFQLRNNN